MYLLGLVLSRMKVLVSFSRVSSVLCFGCHVVGSTRCSGNSAGLLRCRVTSPGKLSSPLKSLSSLFCGVTALARSWTSLVGFVVRVQRAGFQVSLARVGARSYEFRSTRELQEREESERAHSRVVLNCSVLDIAHRRLVQSECRYGAEPRPRPGLLGWNLSSGISLHFWER